MELGNLAEWVTAVATIAVALVGWGVNKRAKSISWSLRKSARKNDDPPPPVDAVADAIDRLVLVQAVARRSAHMQALGDDKDLEAERVINTLIGDAQSILHGKSLHEFQQAQAGPSPEEELRGHVVEAVIEHTRIHEGWWAAWKQRRRLNREGEPIPAMRTIIRNRRRMKQDGEL